MEKRPAVEEWRAALPEHERRSLNNPIVVWRRWTAATRVKKPKPRSAGVSASEHGRARATIKQLQARVTEVEEEAQAHRNMLDQLAKGEICAFCNGSTGPLIKGEHAAICLGCQKWAASEAKKLERK
jgi:hypothetical protein